MRIPYFTNSLALAGALLAASGVVYAETTQTHTETRTRGTVLTTPTDTQKSAAPTQLPRREMTKNEVRRAYGAPEKVHAPVGDPPITRWDYPGFSVFFEYDLVLHAVVPGDFPAIDHRKQLSEAP